MNFGRAFTYVFEDADWAKKVLITGAIMLIPVVGVFYLMGWMAEIIRRVIKDEPQPLPGIDWNFIVKGLLVYVISLVYAIPMIIFVIPPIIVNVLVATIAISSNDSSGALTYVSLAVSLCCYGLMFLYAILMMLLLPAALGNFASQGKIGAGLRFGEVFGLLKAAPGAYLLVLVGYIVAGILAPCGAIACGLGTIFTVPYSQSLIGHLCGQAYKQATVNRGLKS